MATVNLGSIKFKWKGTYNGATAYTVDDVVSYNGSSYICILASTGNLPTNATYFEQMSSAGTNGTNGTDFSTILTTQGDILYRNGSGMQRLGAGTSGQVLQTGGAGANPSWSSVSSDYVKLGETEVTVAVANITIDSFLDDTNYSSFIMQLQGILPSSNNDQLYGRFRVSGSDHTASNYWSVSGRAYSYTSGEQVGTNANQGYDVQHYLTNWSGVSSGSGRGVYGTYRIFGTNTSSAEKHIMNDTIWRDGVNANGHARAFGYHGFNDNVAIDGIKIYFNSGNIAAGKVIFYGLK
jgi:hypothetical protein